MRERQTETGSLAQNEHHWRLYFGGSETPSADVISYSGARKLKEIADVPTPNFSALKRCGAFLPINPVTIRENTETRLPSVGRSIAPGLEWRGAHYGPYPWTLTEKPYEEELIREVVLRAADKAASAHFDGLTFAAEFGKTVEHLAHTASRFNGLTRNLARRAVGLSTKPGRLAKKLKSKGPWAVFQELWLEARFAWRPLIHDVEDAQEAVKHLGDDFKYSKGTGFHGITINDSYDSGLLTVDPYVQKRVIETYTGNRIYRGASWVDFPGSFSNAVDGDVLRTGWELIPYSFVVDYFVDVGGWVNTLIPRLSGRYRGHQASIKTETTMTQEVHSYGINGATYEASPVKTVIEVREYIRFPSGVPFPPVLPRLDAAKYTDLAALFLKGKTDVFRILSRR